MLQLRCSSWTCAIDDREAQGPAVSYSRSSGKQRFVQMTSRPVKQIKAVTALNVPTTHHDFPTAHHNVATTHGTAHKFPTIKYV